MPLPEDVVSKFYVLGGECNYLLQCNKYYRLSPVENWNPKETGNADVEVVQRLINRAEKTLQETIEELCLNARILRKERAVGLIHGGMLEMGSSTKQGSHSLRREVLDEACLRVMEDLRKEKISIPYCAFNGGTDVWVDVGNKRVGVSTLQDLLGVPAESCIHVGDQMYETGNDIAARSCCPTIWISNPTETKYILKAMLSYIGLEIHRSTRHNGSLTKSKHRRKVPKFNFPIDPAALWNQQVFLYLFTVYIKVKASMFKTDRLCCIVVKETKIFFNLAYYSLQKKRGV